MPFDPLVANPGRLEILTALASEARQEFVRLRERTRLTDGNLASHAKRLQSAGLIVVDKQFRDGKPVTQFALTPAGRAALDSHVHGLLVALRPGENAWNSGTGFTHSDSRVVPAAVEVEEEAWID